LKNKTQKKIVKKKKKKKKKKKGNAVCERGKNFRGLIIWCENPQGG
jgi:hypothetical protein